MKKLPQNFLSQPKYKDHNGHDLHASVVDVVTTYRSIGDGFYTWRCAECGKETSSRSCGWSIMGQVLKCPDCKTMNLLLWNGTNDLQEGLGFAREYQDNKSVVEAERERANLARKQVDEIRRDILWIMDSIQCQIGNWLTGEFSERRRKLVQKYENKIPEPKIDANLFGKNTIYFEKREEFNRALRLGLDRKATDVGVADMILSFSDKREFEDAIDSLRAHGITTKLRT